MKQKLLLMGKSGSGKTSMRSVIFSNLPPTLTTRFGATLDYEQNHVRFLGDMILNLWDCGGQDTFMKSYLTSQRTTIFRDVAVLIYVFDGNSSQLEKDLEYYRLVLNALGKESSDAKVFVLVNKMDLFKGKGQREVVFTQKRNTIAEQNNDFASTIFGTSIYDESLYEAWCRVVRTLVPNAPELHRHLARFASLCNAFEVVLYERTSLLVIASSGTDGSSPTSSSTDLTLSNASTRLDPKRYGRTAQIIKAFRYSCQHYRKEFQCFAMEMDSFTAVVDELTKTTFVLVISHDKTIETEAIKMNIRLARSKFEELQTMDPTKT